MTDVMGTKIITIFGNEGTNAGVGRQLVVNKRTGTSYTSLLGEVSKLVEIPGGVKKLYSLPDCKFVKNIEMLQAMKVTDFVAVGKHPLDRSKLPALNEQEKQGSFNKNKPLPGIEGSDGAPKNTRGPSSSSFSSQQKPLPGIEGDELHSSTHMKVIQNEATAASHEGMADELLGAAEESDKHQDGERDRQRRAHQERMATRHKIRENKQSMTVEAYAEGAEAKDRLVEEERARQKAIFENRITQHRKRGMSMREKDSTAAPTRDEIDAAVVIQSNYRGHLARRELADSKKRGAKSAYKRKKGKKHGKKVRKHRDGRSPDEKSTGPVSTRDLLNVKRIPTPDLSISAEEMNTVREKAATAIQAAYKGHNARQRDPKAKIIHQARLEREQVISKASEDKDSPKKKKKRSKKVSKATDPDPDDGVTQPGKMEREASRFSQRGIEDKVRVEETYDIGKKIGDGNFAVVKECVHRTNGKKFALKIIDKAKTRGAKETKMIENEVQTMRAVKHPNCVGLFDVFDTKDELFLVMELVEGGDLFDRIVEKGKYPESDAVRLVRNMATAIQHMHSKNIIHRDLKPENLLVTRDKEGRDTIKLADFGLSMVVDKPLHTICGTPTYVAPEIIADGPTGYGLQVDLWATGVIAYIMLCGFPPFASPNKNQKDLFRKIRSGKFSFPAPYWAGISEEAKDLIKKLLIVDPSERYTAEQLLKHPWIANTEENVDFES